MQYWIKLAKVFAIKVIKLIYSMRIIGDMKNYLLFSGSTLILG